MSDVEIAWGKRVSREFKLRVFELCDNLGWPASHANLLMACMAFETGLRFSPSIKNPGSSACVDTETEILTESGWKRYDEVSIGEQIYSLNIDSWKIEPDRIYDLIVKESDKNYRLTSRSFDAITTHDHRWYLEKRDYNGPVVRRSIVEKTTEELYSIRSSYLYSIIHPSGHMTAQISGLCPYPEPLLTLLGMIVGDGSISKSRRLIELNCPVGTEKHRLAEECIAALFETGPVWDDKGNGMMRCRFNKDASETLLEFFDWIYNETLDQSRFVKKIHPRVFSLLDFSGAQALLKGYLVTDGHYNSQNDTTCFRNTERAVLDDFQHVAILAGCNPREVVHARGGSEHTFPNEKTCVVKDIYTVWLRKHYFTSCNRKQLVIQPLNETITVWCPTTGNHNWIARRNGTVYVTGNCGLIQFMSATAKGLGTTTTALSRMSAVQQLDYVERYFKPVAGKIHSLEDMYMAILWPKAIGATLEYVLWKTGTRTYFANRGLDRNRDGRVTKREATAKVRQLLEQGMLPENLG